MNFLEALISPPRADHILIAKYIIVIVSLLFVPYISIIFGNTLFALGFSFRGKTEENPLFIRFSRDLVDTFAVSRGVALVLGLLPVLTLAICFSQLLYGTDAKISQYFMVTLLFVLAGLISANLFRRSFATRDSAFGTHILLGLLTLGLLKMAIFAFVSSVTVVTFPEKWPLIRSAIPLTFDWNMMARFSHFMMAAFAMTGAAILFFFFNWLGGKQGMDDEYRDYVRKFGGGVALGFSVLQALFLLWYVGTLPVMAKSFAVYFSGISVVFVSLLICYYLLSVLRSARIQSGTSVFVLFMFFFLGVLVTENFARENALQYQNYALQKISDDIYAEIAASKAERAGPEGAAAMGEQVFNQKCIACHRFDQKLVGPAYKDVVPAYNGDVDALKKFILSPVKKNPDFMAMPNPGLKPNEAEAVARYLIEKVKELSNQ